MRPILVAFAILLAGCAEAPAPPDPGPAPVTPVRPVEPTPWVGAKGVWSLRVTPEAIAAYPGDAVPFRADLRGPDGGEGRLRIATGWSDPSRAEIVFQGGRATVEGRAYVGVDERLGFRLWDGRADEHHEFDGPPMEAQGILRRVAFERLEGVSDDPPGLSVEVDGRSARVTFAAARNVTHTGGEAVRAATDLMLVETPEGPRLVAFFVRSMSDAIAYFPEPTRTRAVATMDDLPAGEIRVVAISSVLCFCYEFPPPRVEETTIAVGAS